MIKVKKPVKQRGALITTWLTLIIVSNAFPVYIYLFFSPLITQAFPKAPEWISYIYAAISTINIVFIIFLLYWKKWAFYAFVATSIIALVINLFIGVGIVMSIVGLVGIGILYVILKTKWEFFE